MASKITDKDTAELARGDYDMQQAYLESHAGRKLLAKLDDIERNAMKRAMLGRTPEDSNAYMESRGEVRTVAHIREVFEDVETDHRKAIDYLAEFNAKQNQAV